MSNQFDSQPQPTWSKPCQDAGCTGTVKRWRGQSDVTCPSCGASYNAFGQRLRDDWRRNPSWRDDDIDDLTGFELQQLANEN